MTTQFHFQERRIKRKKDRKMIWVVKDVLDFVYHLCGWLLWGFVSALVWMYINLICGLEYTVKHRGFWIITALFLGWHLSIHMSLMKTIEEFHEDFVIMTNSTLSNSSLLDDFFKNTVMDPEAFSTLEVDNAVEFFGVEKNVMKVHLYYLVSSIVALCVTLIILFVTEFIYFRVFGALIFGRTSDSGNEVENILKDIKYELVKITDALKMANRDTMPAITNIVNLLKNIHENRVLTDVPRTSLIENGDTPETTQASEDSSEMGELNLSHQTPIMAASKTKKRRVL